MTVRLMAKQAAGKKRALRIGRPRGTGSQRVFDALRTAILRLDIEPGSPLEEESLAKKFRVSRTPVREALIRLSLEGLVTLLPNRGPTVAPLPVDELPAIFEALELSQRVAMRWCAMRRTEADLIAMKGEHDRFSVAARRRNFDEMSDANRSFHLAIGRGCGNRYIAQLYEAQLNISLRLARLAFASAHLSGSYQSYYDEVISEHRAMIGALEHQDVEAADRLAQEHAKLFRSRITQYLNDHIQAGTIPLNLPTA